MVWEYFEVFKYLRYVLKSKIFIDNIFNYNDCRIYLIRELWLIDSCLGLYWILDFKFLILKFKIWMNIFWIFFLIFNLYYCLV